MLVVTRTAVTVGTAGAAAGAGAGAGVSSAAHAPREAPSEAASTRAASAAPDRREPGREPGTFRVTDCINFPLVLAGERAGRILAFCRLAGFPYHCRPREGDEERPY